MKYLILSIFVVVAFSISYGLVVFSLNNTLNLHGLNYILSVSSKIILAAACLDGWPLLLYVYVMARNKAFFSQAVSIRPEASDLPPMTFAAPPRIIVKQPPRLGQTPANNTYQKLPSPPITSYPVGMSPSRSFGGAPKSISTAQSSPTSPPSILTTTILTQHPTLKSPLSIPTVLPIQITPKLVESISPTSISAIPTSSPILPSSPGATATIPPAFVRRTVATAGRIQSTK